MAHSIWQLQFSIARHRVVVIVPLTTERSICTATAHCHRKLAQFCARTHKHVQAYAHIRTHMRTEGSTLATVQYTTAVERIAALLLAMEVKFILPIVRIQDLILEIT